MTFIASTITEHIQHEAMMAERARAELRYKELEAKAAAEAKAVAEMMIKTEVKRSILKNLEELLAEGLIAPEVFKSKAAPLQEALKAESRSK